MPQKMAAEMVAASGVTCNHQEMENGERRFRLLGPDGSGYIRCENPGGPVWENSHLHHTTREFILVQQGPVICAVYRQGKAVLRLLETGECFCPDPGVPHDLCMGGRGGGARGEVRQLPGGRLGAVARAGYVRSKAQLGAGAATGRGLSTA